jgi:hypothetical protein
MRAACARTEKKSADYEKNSPSSSSRQALPVLTIQTIHSLTGQQHLRRLYARLSYQGPLISFSYYRKSAHSFTTPSFRCGGAGKFPLLLLTELVWLAS